MVKCMFMDAWRTLHLQGGSFGASPLRNDEEEHGREEHGQTLAKLSCLLPPCSWPGQDAGLCAPRLAKAGFRASVHHFSKGATGASVTTIQSPLEHISAASRSTYSTHVKLGVCPQSQRLNTTNNRRNKIKAVAGNF